MTVETAPQPATTSNRPNALKHGLTVTRYVSPRIADRIAAIRQEMIEIHAPATSEETHLVDRIAIAQAKLFDAEAAWDDRLRWQREHSEELFERQQRERFVADFAAWRSAPFAMSEVFGKTWQSATFLRDLWGAVRDATEHGLGASYDQIKDMVTALGGDWRADRVDIHRGRIFTLALGVVDDPDSIIERWVADSRAGRDDIGSEEDDFDRARWFLATAPPPAAARDELEKIADAQYRQWSEAVERLWPIHLAERARCAESSTIPPIGNAADMHETRLLRRYLTAAENQADKLERRLLRTKSLRPLHELRSGDSAANMMILATRETASPITHAPSARIGSKPTAEESPSQPNDAHADSPQTPVNTNDPATLRNGPATPGDACSAASAEAPQPDSPARRPDPRRVTAAWRNQRKNRGFEAPAKVSAQALGQPVDDSGTQSGR